MNNELTNILNNEIFIICVISYLIGSIIFGLIIGKITGVGDIRKTGSGNVGATNMMRAGGKKLAAITLILDILKGLAAVLIIGHFFGAEYKPLAALAVTCGHIFPIWLKFKGGKGVATALGAFFGINATLGLAFIAVWLITFKLSKISALSAIIAVAASFAYSFLCLNDTLNEDSIYIIGLIAVIIIIRHKENIIRMLGGGELGFKNNNESAEQK